MSSHHFVKEGQEPALFILEAIPFSHVAPLLEWVPHVIVAEQALEAVMSWGIKVDAVIQQNLSVGELTERLDHQMPLEVLAGQNDVLKTAMEYLIRRGYKFVNIISNSSHTFTHDLEKFGADIQITIYTSNDKWSYVTSSRFEKWLPIKHRFYVVTENQVTVSGSQTISRGSWRETAEAGVIVAESPLPFWMVESFFGPK